MKFVILFLIILSLPLVSAELEIGFETSNLPLVDIQTPALPTFNNNTAYVNSTSIWVTDEGDMENVPDLFPTLTGEYLELDGSNANQDIDISPYDLTIGEKLLFALGETIDNIRDGWLDIFSNIFVAGHINQTGNFTGNQIYGEMYYHNHTATPINFATDGLYYNMFMTNSDNLNGFKFNGGFNLNSSLTTLVDGVYRLSYSAIGDGQNNHVYISSIFINETNLQNCDSHKKMSAGGDIVTMNGDCYIRLKEGNNISIRIADVGGTGTGNYYGGSLNLMRIGN